MADPQPKTDPDTVQVSTKDVESQTSDPTPSKNPLQSPTLESSEASNPATADTTTSQSQAQPGIGIEGEFIVWEGRYSYKNFLGRLILRVLASVAWFALAYWAWGRTAEAGHSLRIFAGITGVLVLLYWLQLLWRAVQARLSHYYRLTNKRLFVWSGVLQRRNDQLELVKVNDIYTRHPSLLNRLLNVGTVVIESQEESNPVVYLTGVDVPDQVMDTLWHTSRAERDGHTVRVDQV